MEPSFDRRDDVTSASAPTLVPASPWTDRRRREEMTASSTPAPGSPSRWNDRRRRDVEATSSSAPAVTPASPSRWGDRRRLEAFTEETLSRLRGQRRDARREYGFLPERRGRLPEVQDCPEPPPYPEALYGYPVAEIVDQYSLQETFCVVTKRFSKHYVYRFSATKAFWLFAPWNPCRIWAIRIATHRYFDYLVITTILVNCVFLALSSPPEETEYVFLSIYSVEMLIKSVAKGFILNEYTYLRNVWNWLDFIVVTSGYLTLCVPSDSLEVGSLAGLRTFRVLRALKTVSILPGLKTIVNAMLHSIRMLAEVMALTIFCLLVFALLALQLYMGDLRRGCVTLIAFNLSAHNTTRIANSRALAFYGLTYPNETTTDIDELSLVVDHDFGLCGNATGSRSCPSGYTCYPDVNPNPNNGYTNFDSYAWSILNCLQLITLDYWEDIYNKVLEVSGPASVLFFIPVVFLGSFYLVNLTLAVVAICYQEEAAVTLAEKGMHHGRIPRMSKIFSKMRDSEERYPPYPHPSATSMPNRGPLAGSNRPPFPGLEDSPAGPSNGNRSGNARLDSRAPDLLLSTVQTLIIMKRNRDNIPGAADSEDCPSQGLPSEQSQSTGPLGENRLVSDSSFQLDNERRNNKSPAPDTNVLQRVSEELPKVRPCWEEDGAEDPDDRDATLSARLGVCMAVGSNVCAWTRQLLIVIVNDPLFDLIITLCILLNTAFLAAEHHGMTARTQRVLSLGNLVFTIIFSLEALGKLLALRNEYFRSRWNVFDLCVVAVSLMDLGLETVNGLSVLRTFRLLRVLKLAQNWPTMRMLLGIVGTSLGAVGNMTLVLAVIVYIFAVLGMQLFGHVHDEEDPVNMPRWNFNDFWHSLLMVFRVLCGEWVQPLWECLESAPDRKHLCFSLFLSSLVVGNLLILNLFLAMLLNSFSSKEMSEKEVKGSDSKALEGFRRLKSVLSRRQTLAEGTKEEQQQITQDKQQPPPEQPKVVWTPTGENVDLPTEVIATTLHLDRTISQPEAKTLEVKAGKQVETTEQTTKIVEPCCPSVCYYQCPQLNSCEGFTSVRRFTLSIVEHRFFEGVVLILIFASSILLCFEDVHLPERPVLREVLAWLNLLFTVLFVFEMLLKWLAQGFVKYFSDFWTIMDFVIVNVSLLSIVLESSGGGLYALRAFRTLRALRPLRAVSRWQGMKIVVNALVSAIPAIFNVLLVCVLFWLIFSIMGVQFFSGRFYKCLDENRERLPAEVVEDRDICAKLNFTWENSMINFDNIGNAYLALFQVATFEGWLEVMADATDIRGPDEQPIREANMSAYIYFVVFIICGSFFTLNLFIGVIIDNFNMLKKKYEGGILEMFLTESQKTYYTAMQKLGRNKPRRIVLRPRNPVHALFYDVAISRRFELLVFALILLNMVAMSCEHYGQTETLGETLAWMNVAFTVSFCLEAAIKLIGLRHYYFTIPWNVFDFGVLVASVVGIIFEEVLQAFVISPTLLRVIRLVRIGRVLRLVKAAKGIRKLLFALVISLPALFNIGALLFLVMFIYAIVGMSLFGHVKYDRDLSDMVNFETFSHSMLILFRLSTSAGWNDVLEPLLVQVPNCDPNYRNLPNGNCGYPLTAIIFFVSYIIINYMVIINMYIAVILENLNQASQEEDTGISEEDIESFYICWARYDPHATQFIPFAQLSDFVACLDPPLVLRKPNMPALVAMALPICQGELVHCLDVLHGLTKMVLGDVEDTEEFRKLRDQMDQRFLKSFPSRNLVEVISNTSIWRQREAAAKVIQRAYRTHLQRRDIVSVDMVQEISLGKHSSDDDPESFLADVISSQLLWEDRDNAARVIQRAYRMYKVDRQSADDFEQSSVF